jgi:hypothetical protein
MPLLQKVKWGKGRKDNFRLWFHQELHGVIGDRITLENRWNGWIEQWRAKLPQGQKDFPWTGASNLTFPLTAMHAGPVYADMMQTFHASDFWHVSPYYRPERTDHANALREFLAILDRDFLKMRTTNAKAFLDDILLGTAIYETHWMHEPKFVKAYSPNGTIETQLRTTSQPIVEHLPLSYFYIPADSTEIDPDKMGGARWVAKKFYMRGNELRNKAETSGRLVEPAWDKKAIDHVIKIEGRELLGDEVGTDIEDRVVRKIRDEDEYTPYDEDKIELFEVWVRFDVDGDGTDEDVVLIWHQKSDTIVNTIFNPLAHGKRPFNRIRYLEGFGFYGIGLAEAAEWAQETLTKLLNGQIDNVMLSNTRMYAVPMGANIDPNEGIFPGKVWALPPGESIGEVKLGDIYQSLPQVMGFILQQSENLTSVSELRQGNLSGLPSRTPAATTMSILNEGNKKFDEIMASMRVPLGEVGLQVLQMFAQYFQEQPEQWIPYIMSNLGPKDGELVVEILAGPVDRIGTSFGVIPKATSASSNKEAEKQSFVGVLQLVSQVYPQIVQTALLLDNPQITPLTALTAEAAYRGGVELLKRLLEKFDIQNPDEYIPDLDAIQAQAQQQQQQQGQLQPGQGGAGALPGAQFNPLGGFFGPAPGAAGGNQILGPLVGLG